MAIGTQKKLIDVLVQEGKLKKDIAAKWRDLSNFEIENKLLSEHLIQAPDIARAYSSIYDLPYVSLANRFISPEILKIIPLDLAERYKIIVYQVEPDLNRPQLLRIAVAEPAKLAGNLSEVIDTLEKQKGLRIELAITTKDDFLKALSQIHPAPKAAPAGVNYKTINLDEITIPYEVITKFPEDIARKYQMIVFASPHPSLIKVAVVNPDDQKVQEILDFVKTKNTIAIEEYKVTSAAIERATRFYHPEQLIPKPPPKPVQPSKPQEAEKAPPPPSKPEIPEMQPLEKLQVEKPLPEKPPVEKPPIVKNVEVPPPPSKEQTEAIPEIEKSQKGQVVVSQDNDLDHFVGETVKETADLERIARTENVPKIVAAAVILAVLKKASDIHIEAGEKNVRLRFRIDGILKDVIRLPLDLQPAIVSRIKILSKLKIDESRIPQDGRFDCLASGHAIDLRISTLPTVHGEKIAMRILDKSAHLYTLEELGLTGRNLKVLLENMDKPYGLILSTGPTGSGKTTTLYAILNRISNASVNIVTLEDPVEYEIAGINQCQIRPKIGFSFANGLRSILRQDPNIIMVGEIRDSETAALATHAALTGHVVLSTLHTNDASGALPRLVDMGVEPFFITSLMNAIIAQRLVRRLCPKCKRKAHIPEPIFHEIEKELEKFNLPKPYQFFEGAGCHECELGYKGRIGIFEVLTMSREMENLVLTHKPSSEIKNQAVKEGMITMKQDGLIKALKGITTINEVMRVITV